MLDTETDHLFSAAWWRSPPFGKKSKFLFEKKVYIDEVGALLIAAVNKNEILLVYQTFREAEGSLQCYSA